MGKLQRNAGAPREVVAIFRDGMDLTVTWQGGEITQPWCKWYESIMEHDCANA
jgi:hypothetical protein